MKGNDVFENLVSACGLSPLFARQSMERALRRANVDPERMTRNDILRAMPEIERSIRSFLTDGADSTLAAVARLAKG